MNVASPHYLLFPDVADEAQQGHWRFVLRAVDGSFRLDAEDVEPQTVGERLELLAVVRGLEALDQPSRVTLITTSKYVREGIRHGVMEWRENDWRWERFGQMVPVKNQDLWQRVDRAMRFHKIDCRILRFDSPNCELATEREIQDRGVASRRTRICRVPGKRRESGGHDWFGPPYFPHRGQAGAAPGTPAGPGTSAGAVCE